MKLIQKTIATIGILAGFVFISLILLGLVIPRLLTDIPSLYVVLITCIGVMFCWMGPLSWRGGKLATMVVCCLFAFLGWARFIFQDNSNLNTHDYVLAIVFSSPLCLWCISLFLISKRAKDKAP